MISLSLEELKAIAKLRKIKDYRSKSEGELIKILSKPKLKIEEIRKKNELTDRYTELKVKEIEISLFELKKYYDYDDIKYEGIRDLRNLFDLSF